MATYTTNYNLGKPEASDPFGNFRQLFNDNMDEIDANLGGGGGGGGHTIVDENGSDMPAESKLQFTGNVSVTDDNVNGATVVDVLGGGGNVYGAFVDTNRILLSTTAFTGSYSYTATEDCFVCFYISPRANDDTFIQIDGENVGSWWRSSVITDTASFYVRKGQTISVPNAHTSYNSYIWVYGITQGTNGIYAPVIYSDNERVIGVWRDNKPLYQRTFDLGSDIAISNTSWYSSIVSITNVENITLCFGLYSGGTYYPLMAYHTGNDVNVLACRANSGATVRYLTLCYTKTTDVAGSGNWNTDGVPTHHYSTSEQVVGTWTNGKPCYEITLEGSGSYASNIEHIISIPLNADNVRIMSGFVDIGTDWLPISLTLGLGTGTTNGIYCYPNKSNGLHLFSSAWTFTNYSIVIQYTKTTD